MRARLAAVGLLAMTLARPGLAATSVFVHSEPGDSDYYGEQFAFTGADGQVNVFVDAYGSTYFTFAVPSFSNPNPTFALWLRLRPPSGAQGLAPGTYEFDGSHAAGAQIDFGRGYWGLAYRGRFVVHEVAYPYGLIGPPSVLSVDFEAVRTDDAHPVRGAVRYRAGDEACAGASDGTPCDDHDPCTQDDACAGSVCVGADVTSATCDPGEPNACVAAGRCDPTTGACASGRRPYGSTCDDGNLCTSDDRCSAYGACTGTPPPSCGAGGTALLETTRSVVRWRLSHGPRLDSSTFAAPIDRGGYALCAYTTDRSGDRLLLAATTSAGAGRCAETDPPCWQVGRRGGDVVVRHRGDPHGAHIRTLRLWLDDAGRAQAFVETGASEEVGPRSVTLPLRLQLRGDGGPCLEARYSASGVQRRNAKRFRARGD